MKFYFKNYPVHYIQQTINKPNSRPTVCDVGPYTDVWLGDQYDCPGGGGRISILGNTEDSPPLLALAQGVFYELPE